LSGAGGEPDSLYDEIPYPGHPFAQTHPDRLATLALLFGLRPADVATCRVLELGCGDGGNLMPMATALPDASFAGIDSAAGAIARGAALAERLGLDNLRLEAASFEHYAPEPASFDYVIAHGVYSWVAADARDQLLALCARALAPGGVAYVSYNALPGGRVRQAVRDMLFFHTAGITDPRERIGQSKSMLRFLLAGWPSEHAFATAMRRHAERLLVRGEESLFHDELAEINEPVHFQGFAAHAAAHGLNYLAEADFFEMQLGPLPDEVAQALVGVDDVIRREQYLDFLKGRMFRQTLLCHAAIEPERTPRPEALEWLAVASAATARAVDEGTTFEGPTGASLTTNDPAVIAALERAAREWPAAVPVRELLDGGASEEERLRLYTALLGAYGMNVVQLHAHPPELTNTASERPEASAFARHQASTGDLVTNLRHASLRVEDDLGRHLVTLLDGTRDRAALTAAMAVHLGGEGRPVPENLPAELDQSLQGLARLALLRR
jgi:methyltransferase-like protein/ubiquinone/menaquinone biosynthesis C-methylase UbiE